MEEIRNLALADALDSDSISTYRRICRIYSKTFHTPLHEVYELPYNFILQNIFEHNIDSVDEESLMEMAYEIINGTEEEEALIQEQIKMFEKEEKKRLASLKKRKKIKANKKTEKEEMSLTFDDSN